MKRFLAVLLFAALPCLSAVPFGKEVRSGQVTISVSAISGNVPGAPSTPSAKSGVMVFVKSDNPTTAAYSVVVRAKLDDGRTVTESQAIQRARSWSPYTPSVFFIGRVAELISVAVEELQPTSSADFID